jgi:hypothetical protein
VAGLQVKIALAGDLHTLAHDTHLRLARGARRAAERLLSIGKLKLRGDVRQAGLGDRLANTWRANIYPQSANARTHAPSVVFRVNDRAKTQRADSLGNVSRIASAADIIEAHATGPTIVSRNGLWLAVPTENVPRRGRRKATPQEVEEMFNQDLWLVPGRGQQMLAFVHEERGDRVRGSGTQARPRGGRRFRTKLMFILVRQVRLRARLNYPRIFDDLKQDWASIFPAEIAAELEGGAAANV